MVHCPSCGRLLDSVASVCGFCGAPIPTRVEPPAMAYAATAPGLDSMVPPSGLLRPGQVFDGKYRIEQQLGAGGMSVVYLATEITVETRVVIKALLPHLSCQPGFRERLLREAKALARIDHPNVVGLKSVVTAGNELFLVMEYVQGSDLAVLVESWKTSARPSPSEILAIFGAILDGVEAAHQEGIIHRDLKPSNVLVRTRDNRVKVTDFGIAKSASDGDHQLTSGMIGTLFYMAPEQLQADPTIDARADIYALGVLLFELFTGAVPFHAASSYEVARQHIQVPFPSLRSRGHFLDLTDDQVAMIDVVLGRACAKDRAARYASCSELRHALSRCSASLGRPGQAAPSTLASAPSVPTGPAPHVPVSNAAVVAPPPSSRVVSKAGLGVALGGLLVIGGAAFWWFDGLGAAQGGPAQPRVAPTVTSVVTATASPTATTTVTTAPTATAPAVVKCSQADDCKGATPRNASPVCYQGACSYSCQAGFFDCGGACYDLRHDPKHCGTCGGPGSDCSTQALPSGAAPRCEEGLCTFACASGAERCGKVCCAAGQSCHGGKCGAAAAASSSSPNAAQ